MRHVVDKILDLFGECKASHNDIESCERNISCNDIGDKLTEFHQTLLKKESSVCKSLKCSKLPNGKEKDSSDDRTKIENNQQIDNDREVLSTNVESFTSGQKIKTAIVESANLYRMMAVSRLLKGNELEAVGYLIESHAVILRQQVLHRYRKTQIRKEFTKDPIESGLQPQHMIFDSDFATSCKTLKAKLLELPKEWYMIQVTVQYKPPDSSYKGPNFVVNSMCAMHITVLPSGPEATDPFCITVPKPNNAIYYDGMQEIADILKNNKSDLQAHYTANFYYWQMREKQNNRMKCAIKELEETWLREWRILFMADPLEDLPIVKEMRDMVDKLIADDLSIIQVPSRTRWLLRKIATSACLLTKPEIARAVHYVLENNNKLATNVILSIYGKLSSLYNLHTEIRKSLILIVDESIDHISFESMDVLKSHPATRFPSFHIAYAMFKSHEDTIENGCKIIKEHDDVGSFIVNPAGNLDKMEKRIKVFIDYWLPKWKGKYRLKPDESSFQKALVDHDILLYAGHGSGIQFLPGEKIERLRVASTVLLFGCSSVKLYPVGGRFPPYGISNQYLIANSPCILGMLWEVTDGDIDRMTASFMSDWITSEAYRPWSDVDLTRWAEGVLKFKSPAVCNIVKFTNEPEMLRAVAKSKDSCTQYMTAAAIVVRGLPLRLK